MTVSPHTNEPNLWGRQQSKWCVSWGRPSNKNNTCYGVGFARGSATERHEIERGRLKEVSGSTSIRSLLLCLQSQPPQAEAMAMQHRLTHKHDLLSSKMLRGHLLDVQEKVLTAFSESPMWQTLANPSAVPPLSTLSSRKVNAMHTDTRANVVLRFDSKELDCRRALNIALNDRFIVII